MELDIRGRNLEITDEIESYVRRRLERVNRRLGKQGECKVEISKADTKSRDDRIVAQVTIHINGTLLRAQERGPNVLPAIDSVADVIVRQANRYKGRFKKSELAKKAAKSGLPKTESVEVVEKEAEELLPNLGTVVRTKKYHLKPMTMEEAITQMEDLGHSFFMFLNIGSNQYNVLYRRRDGNYGLIEPELV